MTSTPQPTSTPPRALRADAARNRERILTAAAVVFAHRGLDATLDDVARAAGVGVGTVYRRFENRDALVRALFQQRFLDLAAGLEEAAHEPDAWSALVGFMERSTAAMVADRGLRDLFFVVAVGDEHHDFARERLIPATDALVRRAQQQGTVRSDLIGLDIAVLMRGLHAAAELMAPGGGWRRYLLLIIDSLRPEAALGTEPLPAPPSQEEVTASTPRC